MRKIPPTMKDFGVGLLLSRGLSSACAELESVPTRTGVLGEHAGCSDLPMPSKYDTYGA